MSELNLTFEVLYVEDSGSEDSWNELLRLKTIHPEHVRIIRLSRNFGQNGATLCGIDESKGRKIITIDDDLQTPPSEIAKMIYFHQETDADVVYAKHSDSKTSWFRRSGSKLLKRLFRKSDSGSIGSSFRLIDAHIVDRLRFHAQDHLFINQVISWYTLNAQYIEVEHNERASGKSGYSFFRLVWMSLRLIMYYTSIPIKIMIALSIITAFGIAVMTVYYIYYQINTGSAVDLFMVSVLLAMAVISASISVFGVYINRIYSARVKKPNYAIKVKM
ncbi:MAG: undecaprenyl-phosphate 4-deoxy-4-formamido-L-arabinose transferase [Crocinitomicaceae bacterium]|jgi:undecaprenyl-phosphate 4-deoxy-4-formamido-L-arabinose transferase